MVVIAALIIKSPVKKPKEYTIGVINHIPIAEYALDGLTEGLLSRGYVKGENLKIIYSGAKTDPGQLKKEAERLVSLKPDLIYCMTTRATLAAKAAAVNSGIPIVFGPVSDPIGTGIVENMTDPKRNITGVAFGTQEPRRLELLEHIKPGIIKVLIPFSPGDKSSANGVAHLKAEMDGMDIQPVFLPVPGEIPAVEVLYGYKGDFDAIFIPTDTAVVTQTEKIAQFAVFRKVPLSCPQKEGVMQGALMSYGFGIKDTGRQAARIVHMIFSGTKPGDIPIEITDFGLSINLDTAEKIGLQVPEFFLKNSFIVRQ